MRKFFWNSWSFLLPKSTTMAILYINYFQITVKSKLPYFKISNNKGTPEEDLILNIKSKKKAGSLGLCFVILLMYFFNIVLAILFLYNLKYQFFNTYKIACRNFVWDYIKSIKSEKNLHKNSEFPNSWLLQSMFYSFLNTNPVHFVSSIPEYLCHWACYFFIVIQKLFTDI